MVWSGSRTRDRQIRNLLLYPLSYPVVDVPESNRRPAKSHSLLYPTELPSSRNTFSRRRAYATAKPRAPDGIQTHTAGHRSIDASHWRLHETPIRVRAAFMQTPIATRAEHRGAALACLMAELRRCNDPRWASTPKTFGAGCFGAGVCLNNGSAKPFASRLLARVSVSNEKLALRTTKKNAPGVESEGVRVPRRSERPISWERISRGCGNLSRRAVVLRRTAARTKPHRAGGARVRMAWRCGWRVSWLKSSDSVE
jgi:hypothetical protein